LPASRVDCRVELERLVLDFNQLKTFSFHRASLRCPHLDFFHCALSEMANLAMSRVANELVGRRFSFVLEIY
jgi:hypothetical protein